MESQSKAAVVASIVKTANELDVLGHTTEAERLTKIAEAQVAAMKEDADLDEASGEVADGDPMSKGFGRSICTLHAKLVKMDSGNLQKKLTALVEGSGKKADVRAIRNSIEALIDALAPLCK